MDVVYILGSGSLCDNEELRYSLRSLSLHMLDLGDIYIVGENVSFLKNVHHIPVADTSEYKWKNAYYKTLVACKSDVISEEFLLMNDDFFMLEPFSGEDWPFYALRNGNGGSCGAVDYSIHCPIRIKKEWYCAMPFSDDGKGPSSPRTFYSNFYKAPPKLTKDFVVRVGSGSRPYDEQTDGLPSFSVGDSAMLNDDFLLWLDALYPVVSPYEF